MATSPSPKSDALKQAYDKFRVRIAAARKKTKQIVVSIEERKRTTQISQLEQKIKGSL